MTQPGKVGDWLGEPMFLSQFDAGTTLGLLAEDGFDLVEHAIGDQDEGGREVGYMWAWRGGADQRNSRPHPEFDAAAPRNPAGYLSDEERS